jgi:uncharacterized repeat protein (TIGR01451 family)
MVRSNDMDCSERLNQLRAQNSATRRISLAVAGICCLVASAGTHAAGTTAGREVNNTATVSYEIAGEAQTPVTSNTAQLFVDELLDVNVISDDVGPVGVTSPAVGAVLQFSVTNTGNGTESFRLVADDAVAGDSFDPNLTDIYIETNTTPGLQIGAGGDTPYTTAGDPLLVAEATVVVYLTSGIDSGLGAGLEGAVALRAVPATLIAQIGSDQPVDFPPVGTSYPGAGDPAEVGGGNVTAVVGTSFTQGNLLLLAEGRYVVSAAVVALSKNAVAVLDPFGGATLVPGSVITYEIVAEVLGSGPAEAVAVTDSLPTELLYVPASLTVSFLPVGENADDDFAPSGVDNTGFDPNSQAVTVNLADLAGGTSITITYQASIR